MNKDRFDLEEDIMAVWHTVDDLDVVIRSFYDGNTELTYDNMFNVFYGIKELHDIKCNKLFNTFEIIVENEGFVKESEMEELKAIKRKYTELIMAVGQKFPDESRHETALRYIRNQEYSNEKEMNDELGK